MGKKTIAVLLPDDISRQLSRQLVVKLNSNVPGAIFQIPCPENELDHYDACLVVAPCGHSERQAAFLGLLHGRGVPITAVNCWFTPNAFLWLRWARNVLNDFASGVEYVCRDVGIRLSSAIREVFARPKQVSWGAVHPTAPFSVVSRLVSEEGWILISVGQGNVFPRWYLPSLRFETAKLELETAIENWEQLYFSALSQVEEQYAALGAERLLIPHACPEEIKFVKERGGQIFCE